MVKQKTVYVCNTCGNESGKWLGLCLKCGMYNTFEEYTSSSGGKTSPGAKTSSANITPLNSESENFTEERTPTNISELDRVLNGGIAAGSVILLGGEPGIGKSTLLLQICEQIGLGCGSPILYISGEESAAQIKMRAARLGVTNKNINLVCETSCQAAEAAINSVKPGLVLVDSIQTIYNEDITSVPGSVVQVRECTQAFVRSAKQSGMSVILTGHITKDGAIAGPKVLEHMVDVVLYFEGERHANYRILRSVKNRFGPANEIGVFEMQSGGLKEVANPSEYMLKGRAQNAAGSVVTALTEGTRPILTEVQALVSYTNFSAPRRSANGMDYNRVVMLMAVLEKKLGLKLSSYDSYANIVGGIKITEPAADLALAAAILGSYKNIPVEAHTLVFGEVGLTGEVRAVAGAGKRVQEALRFGFNKCVIPQANLSGESFGGKSGTHIYGVSNVSEMADLLF